jgi:hypothetical protein
MVKRIIQAVVAIFAAIGVWMFHEGECLRIRAEAAEDAVPICLPGDLSRVGVYRGEYRKTFGANHGDYMRLEVRPPFQTRDEVAKALVGFSGRIVVTGEAEESVQDEKVDAETLEAREGSDLLLANIRLATREVATYDVEFHVMQPAQGMREKAQCLVGRYLFCGLEFCPAMLLKAMGVGCWIVAGLIWFFAWVVAAPRPATAQTPPESTARPT